MTLFGCEIRELETEQWVGSEWGVFRNGKQVHRDGAEEGHMFGRLRCAFWVVFHGH